MRKKINPEETVSISFEFILTIQLQKRGRTQHQHARIIGIGQPVAADLPHKFPLVVEIFAKYYYFKVILYKRLPGSL